MRKNHHHPNGDRNNSTAITTTTTATSCSNNNNKKKHLLKRMRNSNNRQILGYAFLVWLFITTTTRRVVQATIVMETKQRGSTKSRNYSYESQPALFGKRFVPTLQYTARIQQVVTDPYLCGGATDATSTTNDNLLDQDDGIYQATTATTTNLVPQVLVPLDGSSVVLIAKRGQCSFETKARTAMTSIPKGVVKYLIIYDNESNSILSPMSANNPLGINIGLLFISLQSGLNILGNMTAADEEETSRRGGCLLTMDSESPWPNNYFDDRDGWIALLFSGFILFSIICGCTLVCCQAGYIRREGNTIIFGPTTTSYFESSSLLTNEQVLALPEVIYSIPTTTDLICFNSMTSPSNTSTSTSSIPKQDVSILHPYENSMCSVCLEEYTMGEQLRLLPCKHTFHTDCILPWLTERSPMCPLCKCDISRSIGSSSASSSSHDLERHENTQTIPNTTTLHQDTSSTSHLNETMDSYATTWLVSSFFGIRRNSAHNEGVNPPNGDLTTPLLESTSSSSNS